MLRIAAFILTLCALSAFLSAQEINVAAASDLNYALREIATRYQAKTGNKVVLSFGSSGNFFSQIQSGAPYDLFFSANQEYATQLAAAGRLEAKSLATYAIGQLVLWVPNNSGLDPQVAQMGVLTDPKVQRIAIANPAHAPYGRAAAAALEHYGLTEKVQKKLVLGENISQAAQFVQSGNAQAGLIALSLALSPAMKKAGRYWILPDDAYPELRQTAGITTGSKHKAKAREFLDYVLSAEGGEVLTRYGFRTAVN